ncbi:ArsR family transcriptional regulator [Haloferax mucosum ATCC BAA-1512]|uniref:ArsR family transcriptional regulator n=1 Tax=Haloferax mucosum ATCC BAA-1512 TaxID=662479 RepID=M0IPX8_9EURY|nr:helix-turn-helix domain-containing protein [Haloferax mucosum]ELZ98795.1 ArsR family transcriptional regulator [Haloferax mucosum ATCC BAA-1512]
MSSLLPLKPSAESVRDRELAPNLVALDDPAADDVLSALSSATARQLLAAVYDDPRPASELADALDTTVQTVSYHLDRLVDADLVEPVTTWVSAQGREMAVYGPTSSAVVLFAGAERTKPRLASGLRTLVTGVGATLVGSLLVQALWTQRRPRVRVANAPQSPDTVVPAFLASYLDGPGALVLVVGVVLTLLVSVAVVWTQRRA